MINSSTKIVKNKKLNDRQYLLEIQWNDFHNIKPSNFFMIAINNASIVLKRPIAIFDYDTNKKTISFIYNVVGKGTLNLSKLKVNDKISVIGPIGNNFGEYKNKNILIVCGGTGIYPMYLFAKTFSNLNKITFLCGVKTKSNLTIYNHLKKLNINLITCSDDGTIGFKGNPIDWLNKNIDNYTYDIALTCGPNILMKLTYEITKSKNIKTLASLEKRMGCGFGVCMACSIKTKNNMRRVCVDGPVFDMDELIYE